MFKSKSGAVLILFILFFTTESIAQSNHYELSGHISDTQNQPIAGAAVRVLNSNCGTISDANGNYSLKGYWKTGSTIQFTFIGMKSRQVLFKGQKHINICLQEENNHLNEVVITAKTNINEIDIRSKTGNVATVDMGRINDKPMIDMGLALQGSVPGLAVTNTGGLGSKPKIRIRGNSSLRKGDITNEPLYVMDGQVISPETFYNLNPEDIKEMKVLKDAIACALYGVKAANGVLEITSKRGTAGETFITYSTNIGITAKGRRGVRMMDSEEKLELERLLMNAETPGYRYSKDFYNRYYPDSPNLQQMIAEGEQKLDSLRQIHTDWFDQLIRRTVYQKHNLSIKGGSDQLTYYASVNYTQQGGRLEGNSKQRISSRLNLDWKLGRWGYFMVSMNGGVSLTDTPNGSNSDPSALVYNLNPYEQRNDAPLYSYPGMRFKDIFYQYSEKLNDKDFGISGNFNVTPLKGLDIAAVIGLDMSLNEKKSFTPSTNYHETHSGISPIERGIFAKSKDVSSFLTSNLRITYNHLFGEKHDLTVGANTDYYLRDMDDIGITGYGVGIVDAYSAINHSFNDSRKPQIHSAHSKTAQVGLGSVIGYTYDKKYDFYATCKLDASSVLPSDKRWNKAWAAGLAWTPSNYAFLKDNKILSHLNFRLSYGYTANLNGVSLSSTVASFVYSSKQYEDKRPLEFQKLYNTELQPEQTHTIDFGAYLTFFKRLNMGFNFYNRKTEQALLEVPIPSSTGYTTLIRNIGKLQNRGVEITANCLIYRDDKWDAHLGFNLAYNQNKVLDLYYTDKIYVNTESLAPDYEVGKSYDMLYGAESLGINPLTGYPVYLSRDGREKQGTQPLTRNDAVALGHLTPPYNGGINVTLSYKNFDFDCDFYYVLGGIRPFNYSYVRTRDTAIKNAISGQIGKMWFKKGDEDRIYANPYNNSTDGDNNIAYYSNSRTVGKSDYLKLSMLSLRYRATDKLIKKLKLIRYASVAFQASNLFTWTSYSEADPESGQLAGNLQPVYTINLNITF